MTIRPSVVVFASLVVIAVSVGGGIAVRPVIFPTHSPEAGVTPSVVGLRGRTAMKKLIAARFGVLPVPVVPAERQQFDSAIVYEQFPPAGTKVSRRLITIYTRGD